MSHPKHTAMSLLPSNTRTSLLCAAGMQENIAALPEPLQHLPLHQGGWSSDIQGNISQLKETLCAVCQDVASIPGCFTPSIFHQTEPQQCFSRSASHYSPLQLHNLLQERLCYHPPAHSCCAECTALGGRNEILGASSLRIPAAADEQERVSAQEEHCRNLHSV